MSMPVAVQVDHRGAYWHTYICFYVMMKTALKIFLPRKQHALLERDSFGNATNLCFYSKSGHWGRWFFI